jgi:LuxR family quorum-sensing system transcriptional regulator CciR
MMPEPQRSAAAQRRIFGLFFEAEFRAARARWGEWPMASARDVQTYVRDLAELDSLGELEARFAEMLGALGVRYYAVVHHVNVVAPPLGFVKLTNYPAAWRDEFTSYNFYADDPTRVACERTAQPFLWANVGTMLRMTQRQQRFMAAARARGLVSGLTVPIHVPGRVTGSVNLAAGPECELRREMLPAAHHVAVFTFEAARRIAERDAAQDIARVALTSRQRAVVQLVAQGKSNWATGQILGIAERTVKEHVQEAMVQYGVSSRAELVVRSLFDGNLSFADVIPFPRHNLH